MVRGDGHAGSALVRTCNWLPRAKEEDAGHDHSLTRHEDTCNCRKNGHSFGVTDCSATGLASARGVTQRPSGMRNSDVSA